MLFDDERPSRACAVCARILSARHLDDVIVEWVHAYQDKHDHIAVPVELSEIHVALRCDLCNQDLGEEVWTLPVKDYIIVPGHMNRGDFAMCPDCKDAYDPNNLKRMVDHVMARGGHVHDGESLFTRSAMFRHFEMVYRNALGPPHRVR